MTLTSSWRRLLRGQALGARNMAVDEAILEACREGSAPPSLSLYAWKTPCLSLGYFQPAQVVDREACARLGLEVVRRPTGGWAVLHEHEVTYSLVAPEGEPRVSGGVLASYRKISLALLRGLALLGVPAEMAPPGRREPRSPACFDASLGHEIVVAGRKLVGSAQVRRGGFLLQQGSILLRLEPVRLFQVLRVDRSEGAMQQFEGRVACLEQVLGREVSFGEVAEAISLGFAEAWDLTWTDGSLGPEEEVTARRLEMEKYSGREWTFRR